MQLEVKKFIKSKKVSLIIIFALFMALYVHFASSSDTPISIYPTYLDKYRAFKVNDAFGIPFMKVYEKAEDKSQAGDKSLIQKFNDFNEENFEHDMIAQSIRPEERDYNKAIKLQNLKVNYLNGLKNLVKESEIEISGEDDADWRWINFEFDQAIKNDFLVRSINEAHLADNLARRLIYNADIYLGVAFLLFFVLLFNDILISEKLDGTYALLFSQVKKDHLVLYKFILILLAFFIYLLSYLVFSLLISLIFQIPITGFREIYRVFTKDYSLRYHSFIGGYIRIVGSAFVINGLMMSIVLFISSISNSKKTSLAWSTSLIVVLSFLTKHFSLLKSTFNPIYALDGFKIFLGNYEKYTDYLGDIKFKTFYAQGYGHLILFFIAILIILWAANFSFLRYKKSESKFIPIKLNKSLFSIELKKIFYSDNKFIYLLITSIVVLSIFFTIKDLDDTRKNFLLGDGGLIPHNKKAYEESLKELEEIKQLENQSEENLYYDRLVEINNFNKQQYESTKAINKAFHEKNGVIFYRTLFNELDEKDKQQTNLSQLGITNFSRYMRMAILKEAEKKNLEPMMLRDIYYSPYDRSINFTQRGGFEQRNSVKSHSSPILLQRMINIYNLDIILLSFIMISLMSGFTIDKDLVNTQPINKWHRYLNRSFAIMIVSCAMIFFVFLLIILMGGISEGFGGWKFPTIYYKSIVSNPMQISLDNATKTIKLIPIWKNLLMIGLTFILQVGFLTSLTNFISLFVKKNTSLIFISITLIIFMYILGSFTGGTLKLINPFLYMKTSYVSDNSIMIYKNLKNGSFVISIIVLISWTMILSVINILIMKRSYQK